MLTLVLQYSGEVYSKIAEIISQIQVEEGSSAATAFYTAAGRAIDALRDDAILNDNWAQLFVGSCQTFGSRSNVQRIISAQAVTIFEIMALCVSLRARTIDNYLEETSIDQVILLGAGFDMRGVRLPSLHNRLVFEVDFTTIIDHKMNILSQIDSDKRDNIHYLGTADLINVELGLRNLGIDFNRPVLWVTEGFFPYLDVDQGENLIEKINRISVSGSALISEQPSTNLRNEQSQLFGKFVRDATGIDISACQKNAHFKNIFLKLSKWFWSETALLSTYSALHLPKHCSNIRDLVRMFFEEDTFIEDHVVMCSLYKKIMEQILSETVVCCYQKP